MRAGFITPSKFKDVMTVAKGYKTKSELEAELAQLADDQHKREQKGTTTTAIYKDTEARIKLLPDLIKNWSPASRFGDTALTYAKEVALGRFGVYKPEINAASLEHGKRFEPEARAAYEAKTGLQFPAENFRLVSNQYPFIAGECDGNIYGKGRAWGGEIKCPFNPLNHLENLQGDGQVETYQWQTAGYCAPWMYGWEGYTFVSYHPYFPGDGNLAIKDFERNESLEKELETTLVLFESSVVQPMVMELEDLFNCKKLQSWEV
jgi:hypothetical protein